MKTTPLLLTALLGLAAPLVVSAATPKAPPRAEVNFFEPEKFTDVRDNATDTDNQQGRYRLDGIRDYILEEARNYLPEGQFLSVTFTDVDLAGDFEPWRGPRWDDVRVVKDIYPPRLQLNFRLVDAEGNVIKEGKRDLKDLGFLMRITVG